MALKNTVHEMNKLLNAITHDLGKAEHGNKAASQRVRTGTIRLEKVAKMFRKESIAEEKRNPGRKKAKSAAPKAKKAANRPSKAAPRRAPSSNPRKRATAKLPFRK